MSNLRFARWTRPPRHSPFSETWHKAPALLNRSRWLANQTTASDSLLTTLRDDEEAIHRVIVMAIAVRLPVEGNHDVRPVHIDRGETTLAGNGSAGHTGRGRLLWGSRGADDDLPYAVVLQPPEGIFRMVALTGRAELEEQLPQIPVNVGVGDKSPLAPGTPSERLECKQGLVRRALTTPLPHGHL